MRNPKLNIIEQAQRQKEQAIDAKIATQRIDSSELKHRRFSNWNAPVEFVPKEVSGIEQGYGIAAWRVTITSKTAIAGSVIFATLTAEVEGFDEWIKGGIIDQDLLLMTTRTDVENAGAVTYLLVVITATGTQKLRWNIDAFGDVAYNFERLI